MYLGENFCDSKDVQFSVKPLSPDKILSSLYNEIVLPQTLISTDEKAARKRKAQLCFEIQRLIPLFELHFDKEGRFWNELSNDAMELAYEQQCGEC